MASWSPEALKDVPSVASHHFDTHGRICMALGRHDEAVALFTAAYESARTTSLAMFASEDLADACERTGDLAAALKHHRRFHALFRQVTSEAAQRSARVAAVRLETQHAHDNAVRHRTMAEDLRRSNEQLTRRADDLLQLSLQDPLTSLGNRRSMEALIEDGGSGHAIVMIDVDRFKAINDGWSHLVGDAVLRQIALLIRGCCRETDTPVRYGGDEFAIVLRTGDTAVAATTAERVRHAVATFDWAGIAERLVVSVSVGFATRTDPDGGAQTGMLAIADRRLYDAKHAGRNRVMGGFAHNDSIFS
jgi:diguanylate cyclase (GGDEF)-like protein